MSLFDSKALLKACYGYIDECELGNINNAESNGIPYIVIDFQELVKYEPEIAEEFFTNPLVTLNLLETCVKDKTSNNVKKVRLIGLPESEEVTLNNLRTEHLDKLIVIKGLIKRKSDVLPKIKFLDYLCTNPSCSFAADVLKVPQSDDKLRELRNCPKCKSGVEKIAEENVDFQIIALEDDLENIDSANSQPKIKQILLEDDLAAPLKDLALQVGSKVEVVGFAKKRMRSGRGGDKTISDIVIEVNNITPLEETQFDIDITKEDVKKIEELSKDPFLMTKLKESLAPTIAGRDEIKEATCYYIVGGSKKSDERSLIHLCTIGNASAGKSKILRRLKKFLPKAVYVSCENASGVGLTGSVSRDELTGQWGVEAGAMAYANNGYFLMDEADKMPKEDKNKLNEGLEHGTISIAKAGVNTQLSANCPTYSVANPKYGKFDPDLEYSKQINFDPTLLSRFDLIFILDHREEESEEELVMDKILNLNEEEKEYIDDELLRKYFIHAKQFNPVIPNELREEIKTFFKDIKQASKSGDLDITYRQLNGLIRLSEARAKLFLRNEVIEEDVQEVMRLMKYTLSRFGVAEIETGVSNNTRGIRNAISEVLKYKDSAISSEDIVKEVVKLNKDIQESRVCNILVDMKNDTEIFEPSRNHFKLAQ